MLLASTWTNVQIVVVDDHSTDGTGDIARRAANGDVRVIVLNNPDLPSGWIGKQWACHNGAKAATGSVLLFTDADTRHGPRLLARSMNAMREVRADLLSVGPTQLMESFWEQLVQPHIFGILAARFGDFKRMNRSTNPIDKSANGQFLLMTRATYDAVGGHEAVRTHIAEDLRLAQELTRLGFSVQIINATEDMWTRMYEGLDEIIAGWQKNVWAGGRDTINVGPAALAVIRALSAFVPLWEVAPAIVLVLALLGVVGTGALIWSALVVAINTLYWAVMHAATGSPIPYALLHPLASLVLMRIFAGAAWNGANVEWKGRKYESK
jgi:chlorobactene glucosyltransferase